MKEALVPFADVRSIGIVRAGGIGDLVVSLPAIAALREAYPLATVCVLGSTWIRRLQLVRRGVVDSASPLPLPAIGALGGAVALDDTALSPFLDAQRGRFDLVIQLHGGGRFSNPFVTALEAAHSVGLLADDAAPLERSVPYRYWQSEAERALDVAVAAGATRRLAIPVLPRLESDAAAAQLVLHRAVPDWRPSGAATPPLVVIHPGATDGRRRWSAAQFAATGDRLAAAGCRVLVIGSGHEASLASSIAAQMREPAINLGGHTSLRAVIGLLQLADLVIANDSGPLHLAHAVGASSIGIYWCGNLINAGPPSRARQRSLLSWRLDCPRCGANCMGAGCEHRDSFVDDVAVDDVMAEALDLLAALPRRGERGTPVQAELAAR